MLRVVQLGLAGTVLVIAVLAAASIAREPEAGVSSENPGGVVVRVDAGSPAWRNGVRIGDRVLDLVSSEALGGWRMTTTDGLTTRDTEQVAYREIHTRHLGWTIVGLTVAMVTALIAYRAMPTGAVVVPLSLAFVAQPLFFAGSVLGTIIGGVALFGAGGLAGAAFVPRMRIPLVGRRRRVGLTSLVAAIGIALAASWIGAVVVAPLAFDPLDALRWPVAFAYAAIGAWLIVDRARVGAAMLGERGPTFVDLAYGTIVVTALIAAGFLLRVEPLVLGVVGILAIVAFPFWRRLTLGAVDRLVTGDVRRDATVHAIESERGRLAREIHDAPLQDLAGVIRELETVPGTSGAAETLRDVTARLREMAAGLHPPVLEDLGLAAALEDLAQLSGTAHPGYAVRTALDDLTGAGQPPEAVAIAAYRVAQEAVANAIRHSAGRTVTISGAVATDAVELEVRDDGVGYAPERVRAARASGHFGLDAMRERADAVGATVSVDPAPTGTIVRFRWSRR